MVVRRPTHHPAGEGRTLCKDKIQIRCNLGVISIELVFHLYLWIPPPLLINVLRKSLLQGPHQLPIVKNSKTENRSMSSQSLQQMLGAPTFVFYHLETNCTEAIYICPVQNRTVTYLILPVQSSTQEMHSTPCLDPLPWRQDPERSLYHFLSSWPDQSLPCSSRWLQLHSV